jgi:hypothetical protein
MIVLQPCSMDRAPTAPPLWLGPVGDPDDLTLLCDFIVRGAWESESLPNRLLAHQHWLAHAGRTN